MFPFFLHIKLLFLQYLSELWRSGLEKSNNLSIFTKYFLVIVQIKSETQ